MSGNPIPVEARFSTPVQNGPKARPASCTMGSGSFPGVSCGRRVTLTPHTLLLFFFSWRDNPLVGLGLFLFHEGFYFEITHDTSQSVGLLWTSDQLVAETSTWQYTTLTTNIHSPSGIRTHDRSRRGAVDLRLRPRDHWDRQKSYHYIFILRYNTMSQVRTCNLGAIMASLASFPLG
jgi:hypothetical protein